MARHRLTKGDAVYDEARVEQGKQPNGQIMELYYNEFREPETVVVYFFKEKTSKELKGGDREYREADVFVGRWHPESKSWRIWAGT